MSEQNLITTAAEQLLTAKTTGEACPPIRELIGETDLDSAYAIQEVNNQKRLDDGAKPVGKKIGLTSPAVQKQLGVDQPDYGLLFEDMEYPDGGTVPPEVLMQPKIEAEIAFVMGKDLNQGEVSLADMTAAIEYASASLEIVGSRIENWNIRITDTIADNAAASQFVLGKNKAPLDQFDVVNCRMIMERDGAVVSEGSGVSCMGSPLIAAQWLANTMNRMGRPLKKGDVVLTGALGPMVPVVAGDNFRASIEGLGEVSISFGH